MSSSKTALNENPEHTYRPTEVIATTPARRWWIRLTWLFTWWIPSFLLRKIGRMERADIRMAWREKVTIFMMIMGLCGIVLFYIIGFGKILCPDSSKAWNPTELATHQGTNDYYAAIAGKVYDVSGHSSCLCLYLHGDPDRSSRTFTPETTATSTRTTRPKTSCSSSRGRTSPTTSRRL